MWTEERIERLKALWAQGFSATQVANDLDCGISRSAVCGKVHRLNLSGTARPTMPRVKSERRSSAGTARSARPTSAEFNPNFALQALRLVDLPAPKNPVGILDLKLIGQCRRPLWPHDTRPAVADMLFCGDPTQGGVEAFCKTCRRVMWQPGTRRERVA